MATAKGTDLFNLEIVRCEIYWHIQTYVLQHCEASTGVVIRVHPIIVHDSKKLGSEEVFHEYTNNQLNVIEETGTQAISHVVLGTAVLLSLHLRL